MSKSGLLYLLVGAGTSLAVLAALGSQPVISINIGSQPQAVTVDAPAKDLSVSCPGGAIRIGGSNGLKVDKVDRYASARVDVSNSLSANQELLAKLVQVAEPQKLELQPIDEVSNSQGLTLIAHDETGSAVQSSGLLAALQSQLLRGQAINGLAAVTCQPASAEQWLVGAQTLTGRESILVLQNNTDLDATANLTTYTEGGALTSASVSGVVVAANDFTVVPLASLAPKAKTIALEITSSGGAITAWVQQKTTRGLSTGGFDYIVSQPKASTKLSIPGLLIRGSTSAQQLIDLNSDYRDLIPSLHVFVPGEKPATFTAQVVSSTEGAFGTVIKQTVEAGKINRFEIPGLSDGDYAVLIDSDEPIQAEILFGRVSTAKTTDFAYLSPSPAITAERSLVAPKGFISRLSLLNASDQLATVTLSGAEKRTLQIEKSSATQVLVSPGQRLTVSSDVPVAATLVLDASGAVTAANLIDYRNVGSKVSVIVR